MSEYKLSDFLISGNLGEGGFGSVCLARRKTDGQVMCIKFIPLIKGSSNQNAIREAKTLSKLDHRNIVKYYGSFVHQASNYSLLCIIMEYASQGSLSDLIRVCICLAKS